MSLTMIYQEVITGTSNHSDLHITVNVQWQKSTAVTYTETCLQPQHTWKPSSTATTRKMCITCHPTKLSPTVTSQEQRYILKLSQQSYRQNLSTTMTYVETVIQWLVSSTKAVTHTVTKPLMMSHPQWPTVSSSKAITHSDKNTHNDVCKYIHRNYSELWEQFHPQ